MARFLLVGGAGFIGSHLARRLADHGEEVTVLDSGLDYGRTEHARKQEILDWRRGELLADVPVIDGDTSEPAQLREVFAAVSPTHVVQLANMPLADLAANEPEVAKASIVDGSVNVLEAAAGLRRRPALTYVSSSMVYGDFTCEPMPEDARKRPRGPYGRLKLAAEHALLAGAALARVPLTIVRPSAVYGPGDVNGRVLQRLVDAAALDLPFVLHASLDARLDFTSAHDLAAGIHAAAFAPGRASGGVYNVTAGEAHSLRDAIAIVSDHAPGLRVVSGPAPAVRRPTRGTLDIGRARRELGWAPRWTLREGLSAYAIFADSLGAATPVPGAPR